MPIAHDIATDKQSLSMTVAPAGLVAICHALRFPIPLGLEDAHRAFVALSDAEMDASARSVVASGAIRRGAKSRINVDAVLAAMLLEAAFARRLVRLSVRQGGRSAERVWYVGRGVQVVQTPAEHDEVCLLVAAEPDVAWQAFTDGLAPADWPAGAGGTIRLQRAGLREAYIAASDKRECAEALEEAGVPTADATAFAATLCTDPAECRAVACTRIEAPQVAYATGRHLSWFASRAGIWCASSDGKGLVALEPIDGQSLATRMAQVFLHDNDGGDVA